MSRITINHETTNAPAGNPLIKHPSDISTTSWRRITIAWIQAGQPRPYADSVYEAEISFEGGCNSTVKGYDLPFGSKPGEDQVRSIARLLVHNFTDKPQSLGDGQLQVLRKIEEGPGYSIWHVKIMEPYW